MNALIAQDTPAPQNETGYLLRSLTEAAMNPQVDAAKIRELWAIMVEIQDRDAQRSYRRDFQAACSEMAPVVRDAEARNNSDEVTNRYARLETIDKAIRPIYAKHGFVLTFSGGEETTAIKCRVIHREGHVEDHFLNVGVLDATNKVKNALQAVGSTLTYLRRYLTCLIFNIQFTNDQDDNDGVVHINQDQANQLQDVLIACNDLAPGTEARFLGVFKIKRVDDLPAGQFRTALTQAQTKLRTLRGNNA